MHFLVGGFNPSERYESKWESSPIFGVKITNIYIYYIWNHHLVFVCLSVWLFRLLLLVFIASLFGCCHLPYRKNPHAWGSTSASVKERTISLSAWKVKWPHWLVGADHPIGSIIYFRGHTNEFITTRGYDELHLLGGSSQLVSSIPDL